MSEPKFYLKAFLISAVIVAIAFAAYRVSRPDETEEPPPRRIEEFEPERLKPKPVNREYYDDSENFPTIFPFRPFDFFAPIEIERAGWSDEERLARTIEAIRREKEYPPRPGGIGQGSSAGYYPRFAGTAYAQVAVRVLPEEMLIEAIEKEENADIATVFKLELLRLGNSKYVSEIPAFIRDGDAGLRCSAWRAFGYYIFICEHKGYEAEIPDEIPELLNAIRDEGYRRIQSPGCFRIEPVTYTVYGPFESTQKSIAKRLGIQLKNPLETTSKYKSYWEAFYACFSEGNTRTRFNLIYALGDYENGDEARQLLEKFKKELSDSGGPELLITECERSLKKYEILALDHNTLDCMLALIAEVRPDSPLADWALRRLKHVRSQPILRKLAALLDEDWPGEEGDRLKAGIMYLLVKHKYDFGAPPPEERDRHKKPVEPEDDSWNLEIFVSEGKERSARRGVPGISIVLRTDDARDYQRWEFTTDAEGRIRTLVGRGNYSVSATVKGLKTYEIDSKFHLGEGRKRRVELLVDTGKNTVIHGTITSEDDSKPVSGATLKFFRKIRHKFSDTSEFSAVTYVDGSFEVPVVPGGYKVVVNAPGFIEKEGYTSIFVFNRKRLDLALPTTIASLFGTVTDAAGGEPIARALVKVIFPEGGDVYLSTDADGNYQMTVRPGPVRLVCEKKPDYLPFVLPYKSGLVLSGEYRLDIELHRIKARKVVGVVVEEGTGKPVAGAVISYYPALERSMGRIHSNREGEEWLADPFSDSWMQRTKSDGTFSTEIPEKSQFLIVIAKGYSAACVDLPDSPDALSGVQVYLKRKDSAKYKVRIYCFAKGLALTCPGKLEIAPILSRDKDSGTNISFWSDSEKVEFENASDLALELAEGEHAFKITLDNPVTLADGGFAECYGTLIVAGNTEHRADIETIPPLTCKVRVTAISATTGKPVKFGWLTIYKSEKLISRFYIDLTGRFAINVPAGEIELVCRDISGIEHGREVITLFDEDEKEIEIVLSK